MISDHKQFELFGKKTFEKAVVKPPFRMIAQFPDEACFYYITSGSASVVTPMETLNINTSEGIVMQCGTYLNEFLCEQEVEHCEAIAVHLYPDMLKLIYDKDLPEFLEMINQVKPLPYRHYPSSELIKGYIDSLQFYFDHPQLVSEELLKLKLKELLLLLVKTDSSETLVQLLAGLFTKAELDFKKTIEVNLFNNFSLEELAALTNLSLSSFKREFTKHYGTSPAKYIRSRKLEKAAQLLKGTSLRISDIAIDCGFGDLAHFSKSFQKEYTLSPTDYRLSHSGKSLG